MHCQSGILLGNVGKEAPERIVSLVPSQTELLSDLGLDNRVAGITKFCVHPSSWKTQKAIIGGTKQIDLEKLFALKPDLVLANKEENIKEQVDAIVAQGIPVYVSLVETIEDAYGMIHDIGELTQTMPLATKLSNDIKTAFLRLSPSANVRYAYFVWKDPYMVAGGDTFISNVLGSAGMQNVFAKQLRYPAIDWTDQTLQQADIILLSSEPFPFSTKHLMDIPHEFANRVLFVDCERISWFGSRLLHTPEYLQKLSREIQLKMQ